MANSVCYIFYNLLSSHVCSSSDFIVINLFGIERFELYLRLGQKFIMGSLSMEEIIGIR